MGIYEHMHKYIYKPKSSRFQNLKLNNTHKNETMIFLACIEFNLNFAEKWAKFAFKNGLWGMCSSNWKMSRFWITPVENYINTEAGGIGSYSTFWASQIANRLHRWNVYRRKANASTCPINALTTWVYKEVHLMTEEKMHTFYEVCEKVTQAGLLFVATVA